MIAKDRAGNEGEEECHEITLKKINVDGDEDDDPDFNDPDGDGYPDLNIVLGKDDDGFYIKVNVDKDHDGLPELNIDSNRDGIADINVDQDGDGKADLNIVTIRKWNPGVCVSDQAEEYCTDPNVIPNINVDLDQDGRPDINIDLDQDGIPDIDIDSDGDGISDINIDKDKDGTADDALIKLNKWTIDEKIFQYKDVKFQTMTDIRLDEKDKLTDKDITVEKADGGVFASGMELKVNDVTAYQKAKMQEKAKEFIEEAQEIKQIFEIKLYQNGVEIEPKEKLRIRIPIQEGIEHPKLIRKKADGTYEQIAARIEERFFVYESDTLGIVAIIADKEESNMDIKGNYYPGGNSGGALTGDTTDTMLLISMLVTSLITMILMVLKKSDRQSA